MIQRSIFSYTHQRQEKGSQRRSYTVKVGKNDSLFDHTPENIARMKNGKAPIGKDGKAVELHHLYGKSHLDKAGLLVEVSCTTHDLHSKYLHKEIETSWRHDELARKTFRALSKQYWKARGSELSGGSGGGGGGGGGGDGDDSGGNRGKDQDHPGAATLASQVLQESETASNLFDSQLTATDLRSSYASTCGDRHLADGNREFGRGPGGVAVPRGRLEAFATAPNLFVRDSEGRATVDLAVLGPIIDPSRCMQLPLKLTQAAITQRIWVELCRGISVARAYPFFSLHFNDDSQLYPVLHPIYEGTIVGHVIATLDFFLKGFLNGGIYDIDFLSDWHSKHGGNVSREFLSGYVKQMRSLVTPILQEGEEHYSLREELAAHGLSSLVRGSDGNVSDGTKSTRSTFLTSFRIIGEMATAERKNDLFVTTPSFRVEYTVEASATYQRDLDAYHAENGTYPEDYNKLHAVYKQAARRVETQMPRVPLFQPYFDALRFITAASAVITSLPSAAVVPYLHDITDHRDFRLTPPLYPPLPVRYFKQVDVSISLVDVVNSLRASERLPNFPRDLKEMGWTPSCLDRELVGCLLRPFKLSAALQQKLKQALQATVRSKLPLFGNIEGGDMDLRKASAKLQGLLRSIVTSWPLNLPMLVSGFVSQFSTVLGDFEGQSFEKELAPLQRILSNLDTMDNRLSYIENELPSFLFERTKHQFLDQIRTGLEEAQRDLPSSVRSQRSELEKALTTAKVKAEEMINNQTRNVPYGHTVNWVKVAEARREIEQRLENERNEFEQRVRNRQDELARDLKLLEKGILPQTHDQMLRGRIRDAVKEQVDRWRAVQARLSVLPVTSTSSVEILAKNLHLSMMGLTDVKFLQEEGNDVRIVGGCGVSLQDLPDAELSSISSLEATELQRKLDEVGASHPTAVKLSTHTALCWRIPLKTGVHASAMESMVWFGDRPKGSPSAAVQLGALISASGGSPLVNKDLFRDEVYALFGGKKPPSSVLNQAILSAASALSAAALAVFLDMGSPDQLDHAKRTPLLLASSSTAHTDEVASECIRLLVSAGANVNYHNGNGITPLFALTQNGMENRCLALLSSSGINPNICPDSRVTPLHCAVVANMPAVILRLIELRASLDIQRRTDDATPFLLAAQMCSPECLSTLLSQDVSQLKNQKLPSSQRNALHCAVVSQGGASFVSEDQVLATVELLISTPGAPELTAPDNDGDSALTLAVRCGLEKVAARMVKALSASSALSKAIVTAAELGLLAPVLAYLDKGVLEPEPATAMARFGLTSMPAVYEQVQRLIPAIRSHLQSMGKKEVAELFSRLAQQGQVDLLNRLTVVDDLSLAAMSNDCQLVLQVKQKTKISNSKMLEAACAALRHSCDVTGALLLGDLKESISDQIEAQSGAQLLEASLESGDERMWALVMQYVVPTLGLQDGGNALHYVVRHGLSHLIAPVANAGVDFYQKDSAGLIPLDVAIQGNSPEVISLCWAARPATISKDEKDDQIEQNNVLGRALYVAVRFGSDEALKLFSQIKESSSVALAQQDSILHEVILQQPHLVSGLVKLFGVRPTAEVIVSAASTGLREAMVILLNRMSPQDIQHTIPQVVDICTANGINNCLDEILDSKYSYRNILSRTQLKKATELSKMTQSALQALEEGDRKTIRTALACLPKNGANLRQKGDKPLLHILVDLHRVDLVDVLPLEYDLRLRESTADMNGIEYLVLLHQPTEIEEFLKGLVARFGSKNVIKAILDPYGSRTVCTLKVESEKLIPIFTILAEATKESLSKKEAPPRVGPWGSAAGSTSLHLACSVLRGNYFRNFLQQLATKESFTDKLHSSLKELKTKVIGGKKPVVKFEINNRFLCSRNFRGQTALHCLASTAGPTGGLGDHLELLLAAMADPSIPDANGNTVLHTALLAKGEELAALLLTHPTMAQRRRPNAAGRTPWMLAVLSGIKSQVRLLAPRLTSERNKFDHSGANVLMMAAKEGREDLIQVLVDDFHVDFTAVSPGRTVPMMRNRVVDESSSKILQCLPHVDSGSTALHEAAKSGASDTIRLLCGWGLSLEASNDRRENPSSLLIKSGRLNAVDLLDELQVSISSLGPSLMMAAARADESALVNALVFRGVTPGVQDTKLQVTALHIAAAVNATSAASALLRHGVDIAVRDAEQRTPMHYAAEYGSAGVLELLLSEERAHDLQVINAQDKGGQTALSKAVEALSVSCVVILLAAGADPSIPDVQARVSAELCASRALEGDPRAMQILWILESGRQREGRSDSCLGALKRLQDLGGDDLRSLENVVRNMASPQHGGRRSKLENIQKVDHLRKTLENIPLMVETQDPFRAVSVNISSDVVLAALRLEDAQLPSGLEHLSLALLVNLDQRFGAVAVEAATVRLEACKGKQLQAWRSILHRFHLEDGFYSSSAPRSTSLLATLCARGVELAFETEPPAFADAFALAVGRALKCNNIRQPAAPVTALHVLDLCEAWGLLVSRLSATVGANALRILCEAGTQGSLRDLLRAGQALLDLGMVLKDKFLVLEELLDNTKSGKKTKITDYTLEMLTDALVVAQVRALATRFPDKTIEAVAEGFASPSIKTLSKPEIDGLIRSVKEMVELESQLAGLSQSQIATEVINSGAALGSVCKGELSQPEHWKLACRVLAGLRLLMRMTFMLRPYTTQLVAVMGLLNFRTAGESVRGRIAQVRTGEGKSAIIALLVAFLGVCGRSVDIITSSQYLAARDAGKFAEFFAQLGLSTSHICVQLPEPYRFATNIVYGTNTDFEFALLRRMLKWPGGESTRVPDVVVVDEADNLFIDTAESPARLAVSSPYHTAWVYESILTAVQANSHCDVQSVRDVLKNVQQSAFVKDLENISNDTIAGWIDSARSSLDLKRNVQYLVRDGKIVLIDNQNTGQMHEGSRWSRGIHEFVEVREGLQPESQNLTAASLSHPSFFSLYNTIFGVTGTMGSADEREEVEVVYHTPSFDVPTHRPRQLRQLDPILVDSDKEEEYLGTVVEHVSDIAQKERPVLVLCISVSTTLKLERMFRASNPRLNLQLLNKVQAEAEELVVMRAGNPGMVTIATNAAGRGTDIKLSEPALSSGGLHVVLTFFPPNMRVEEQGMGRAGRQGEPGSALLMLDLRRDDRIATHYMIHSLLGQPLTAERLLGYRTQQVRELSSRRKKLADLELVRFNLLRQYVDAVARLEETLDFQGSNHEQSATQVARPQLEGRLVTALSVMIRPQSDVEAKMVVRATALRILHDQWAEFFTRVCEDWSEAGLLELKFTSFCKDWIPWDFSQSLGNALAAWGSMSQELLATAVQQAAIPAPAPTTPNKWVAQPAPLKVVTALKAALAPKTTPKAFPPPPATVLAPAAEKKKGCSIS